MLFFSRTLLFMCLVCLVGGFHHSFTRGRLATCASEKPTSDKSLFPFDSAFLGELSRSLGLSESAKQLIEERRLSSTLLSIIDKEDLSKIFPLDDALKIYAWSKIKARESKLLRAKSVSIFSSTRRAFMKHIFLGQSDFLKLLTDQRSSGLVSVESEDLDMVQLVSNMDQLVNGTRYHFDHLPLVESEKLRQDLARADQAKADYNTVELLANHFGGTRFEFLAHCVNLTDPVTKSPLGDIDTLLSSHNGSIVALVERKGSLSNNSIEELLSQVKKTKTAFDLCAQRRDPKLMDFFRSTIAFGESNIISVVYCKAGPSDVFRRLQQEGIFVVKDGVELIPPTLP